MGIGDWGLGVGVLGAFPIPHPPLPLPPPPYAKEKTPFLKYKYKNLNNTLIKLKYIFIEFYTKSSSSELFNNLEFFILSKLLKSIFLLVFCLV